MNGRGVDDHIPGTFQLNGNQTNDGQIDRAGPDRIGVVCERRDRGQATRCDRSLPTRRRGGDGRHERAPLHRAVSGTTLDPVLIQPMIDAAVRFKIIPQRFPAMALLG
jgi:hypothetical protein